MTREEILAELDEATSAFAAQIAASDETTGVPKPPRIEVTESSLDPVRFNFDLSHDPRSESGLIPDGGGGPVFIFTGACCYGDGTCDVLTESLCTSIAGNYQGNGSSCGTAGICLGACCYTGIGCVPNVTSDTCATGGGTFQDFQSDCSGTNPCNYPPCPCAAFTSPYFPGQHFLSLESYGTVTTEFHGADCTLPGCNDVICESNTICDGSGAISTIDPLSCELTEVPGSWNSINHVRKLCEGGECTDAATVPDVTGSYTADSPTFCGLGIAPLSYDTAGGTVHGHFVDDLTGDCDASGSTTYDVYSVFSNPCFAA